MAQSVSTVLYSQNSYYRTSLVTLFQHMERVNLVDVLPFNAVFQHTFMTSKNEFTVVLLDSFNSDAIQSELIKRLVLRSSHKALVIGADPIPEYDKKKLVFHKNVSLLSQSKLA